MDRLGAEALGVIQDNLLALKSTEKKLESIDENFRLADLAVKSVEGLEKPALEQQLKILKLKDQSIKTEYSDKLTQKNSLRSELESYNKNIEGYLNKLKDYQQTLASITVISQEDNELNINYEKEIILLRKKLENKYLSKETLMQANKNLIDELDLKKNEIEQLLLNEDNYMNKLKYLKEQATQKNAELIRQEETIKDLKKNALNRSISPPRSPKRSTNSPLRLRQNENSFKDSKISISQSERPNSFPQQDNLAPKSPTSSFESLILALILFIVLVILLKYSSLAKFLKKQ
jgi:chromosome segregation ATPase